MVRTIPRTLEVHPVESASWSSAALRGAMAEAQGKRPTQEDAFAYSCEQQWGDFWVLDGHRGSEAAHFGATALREEIGGAIKKGKLPSTSKIEQSFRSIDNQLRKHFKQHPDKPKAGTTVVGALVAQQKDGLYEAKLINCGDSRGIIIQNPLSEEGSLSIIETIDHKPGDPIEKARILAAGGKVKGGGSTRIDGKLAVSRGLGDFDFKADKSRKAAEQKVSCQPDVYEASNLLPGSLVVLACDGVWGVLSSQEVAATVQEELQRDPQANMREVAAKIVELSLELGSTDNLTVLLVHLVGPQAPEGTQGVPPDTAAVEVSREISCRRPCLATGV